MSIFNPEHNAFNPARATEQLRAVRTESVLTSWQIGLNEVKLGHRTAHEQLSIMNRDIDRHIRMNDVYIEQLCMVRNQFASTVSYANFQ